MKVTAPKLAGRAIKRSYKQQQTAMPLRSSRGDVQVSWPLEWIINSMSAGIGWLRNQLTIANSKGSWLEILLLCLDDSFGLQFG